MQLNHPGLTPAELSHLGGMIAEGSGDYAKRHGPFRAVVIGAFMAEACHHFSTFVGPRKPAKPVTYERPDHHYDHVYRWVNGTLTESIEWVPRQDLMAAAWAAERSRNHYDR